MSGRVLPVFVVQGGGCGGCGLEIDALCADGRLAAAGLELVATPAHAELLLVSGSFNAGLMPALEAAWAAMAEPKWLLAAGSCALDGGPFRDGYAASSGVGNRLPVTLAIPGNPPTPDAILAALRLVRDAISEAARTPPRAPRREPPPAALPHPPAGGDSSAG